MLIYVDHFLFGVLSLFEAHCAFRAKPLTYARFWLLGCFFLNSDTQEFCRDPVGGGNFTISNDREVAAAVLKSMFTKRMHFCLKSQEFHRCSAEHRAPGSRTCIAVTCSWPCVNEPQTFFGINVL